MKQLSKIAKIGERITTQDNRITDQPIFVVEKSVTVITDPDYGYDVEVWVNQDDYNEEASETKARRLDILNSNFRWFRSWRKFYLKETWEFVTACFTEQGCKDYLKADGHNLGKTRIYAYGSYRNEEYQAVRNFLIAHAQPEKEGLVLMPKRLTAENGAKTLLSGEFSEKEERECPACLGMGLGEDDEECLECLGYGYETVAIDISWSNIKKIYAMAVKHLAGK